LRVELFPNNGRIKQKQKRNKCVHRNVSQTWVEDQVYM
jgi:hypothetical protein